MALELATLTKCGVPEDIARRQLPHMAAAMRKNGITTRPRARAFLATVLHESMGLRATTEQASGAKYEGRRDLGNTQKGDGERFKGRGPIQLTGRANYSSYGRQLNLDLVGNPDMVARPEIGWKVAGVFFQKCLPAADAGDFRRVTKLVNGGLNGWDDRLRYWNRLAKLGVVPGSPDIKRGAKGKQVETLTRRLSYLVSKKTGKPYLDGARSEFDRKTTRALRRFQKERGLKVDGVFGPRAATELDRQVRAEKVRRQKGRKPATAGAATPAAATGTPEKPKKPKKPAAAAAGAAPGTARPHKPAKGPSGVDRVNRLWRRLERLDQLSDSVRAQLAALGPPGAQPPGPVPSGAGVAGPPPPPPGPPAETLPTAEVIAQLKKVDAESVRILAEVESQLVALEKVPEASVVAARVEAAPVATATATVATGDPVAVPPPPSPGPPTEPNLAELSRLDGERDHLRAIVEQRARDAEERVAHGLDAAGAGTPMVDNASMQRFMMLMGQLDAIDVRADRVRHALRKATGVRVPAAHENGKGGDQAQAAGAADERPDKPSGARTFRLGSRPMKGDDIRGWQKHLNKMLRKLKVDYEVAIDGEYGGETARCSKQVLYALGLTSGKWAGVTPALRIKARNPSRRTPAELAAARRRRPWLAKLRKKHAAPKGGIRGAVAYARKHAQMGTRETRTNGGPFIDDWCRGAMMQPGLASSAWCGAFANACLKQGGLKGWVWVRYTPSIVNNAKAGVDGWSWQQTPKVGDLVLFNWPGRGDFVDHVGIVVETHGDGSVKTVEGNMGNRVGYWDRKSMILGYARPPWR